MRRGTWLVLTAALLLGTSGAVFAESHTEKKPSCDDIQAKWEMGGGTESEDMLAKKMNVPVERIRECLKKDAMEQEKADNPPKSK